MSALRRLPLLLVPALLSVSLAACGDEPAPAEPTKERLDAVEISGEVGDEPEVTWSSQMTAGKIEAETLVTGDGAKLEEGDQVLAHLWIGNGFTEEKAFSTHDEDSTAELVTVDAQLPPFLAAIKGATVGSRIAVTASAEEAFGAAGNAQLGHRQQGLGPGRRRPGLRHRRRAHRHAAAGARWVPPLEFKKGVISGFDFEGVPEPTDKLQKAVLFEGDGRGGREGQRDRRPATSVRSTAARSRSTRTSAPRRPTSFAIGNGAVIKGWDQTLVGSTVGTRMVIAVPPELGYGEEGNPDAGIKRTDTLYFVIDVLATA